MQTNKDTLLMRIYLPFLAFIVIPMLLLNGAAFQLLNGIRQRDYKENLSRTEAAGSYLSNILGESIALSRKVLFDNDLQGLAYVKSQKAVKDYGKILTTDGIFQKYLAASSEHYSLHIFYMNSAILISSDGSCNDLSYFYGKAYQFGGYSLETLHHMAEAANYDILFHAQERFLADGESYDGFFYTTALNRPTGNQQNKGLILSVIHQDLVERAFAALNESGGFTYITDRSGSLLTTSGEPSCQIQTYLPQDTQGYLPDEIYGRNYIVSYTCLPEGINIYNVKPTSVIIKNTSMLTALVLVLNLICISVCSVMAVSIARKRSRKLRQTFSMLNLPENEKHVDYYDSINHGIAALVDKNQRLSVSLTRDIFLLRYEFWNKLLRGGFSSVQEMEALAADSDMNLKADCFCLLILAVKQQTPAFGFQEDGSMESESVRAFREALADRAETQTAMYGYAHNMPVQQTLVLLRISKEDRANYQRFAESLLGPLLDPPAEMNIGCVGSRLFDSVMAVSDEYAYCSNILLRYYESLSANEGGFVWSGEEYGRSNSLYFPQKFSEQMIASIRSGEENQAIGSLREILSQNFDSGSPITPVMSTLLITRIKLILMEVYQEEMDFDLHKQLRQIDALPSDAVKISYFISLTSKMCGYYHKNIQHKTEKLRQKITRYIAGNFTSPTFSLTEVASHCGFSDSYFSMLFREVMQVNFSAYVERLKMEFADQLLRETSLKVDEIAQKTGYADSNTFRRAYKKYYGVSPSQRRNGT